MIHAYLTVRLRLDDQTIDDHAEFAIELKYCIENLLVDGEAIEAFEVKWGDTDGTYS